MSHLQKIKRIFFLAVSVIAVAICLNIPASDVHASEKYIRLKDLSIGDVVVDYSWDWDYRRGSDYSGQENSWPVEWIVVGKNHFNPAHPGYGQNGIGHVVLLSLTNVARYPYDNSLNRDGTGQRIETGYGSNNWFMSGKYNATAGIRPFLNRVFLDSFSEEFKGSLFPVDVPYVPLKRGPADKRPSYETSLNFVAYEILFILSETELGGDGTRTLKTGQTLEYFQYNAEMKRRAAGPVDFYWTRSVDTHYRNAVRMVCPSGKISYGAVFHGLAGVRPAVAIRDDVLVKALYDFTIEMGGARRPLYEIYWPPAAKEIELDKSEIEMFVGDGKKINARLNPIDATEEIFWMSSDESVVKVDSQGNISAIGSGRAHVFAYAANPLFAYHIGQEEIYASCSISVKKFEKDVLPSFSAFEWDVFDLFEKPVHFMNLDFLKIAAILSKQESVTLSEKIPGSEMIMENVFVQINTTDEVLVIEEEPIRFDPIEPIEDLEEALKNLQQKRDPEHSGSISEDAKKDKEENQVLAKEELLQKEPIEQAGLEEANIEAGKISQAEYINIAERLNSGRLLSARLESFMSQYGISCGLFDRFIMNIITFTERVMLRLIRFIENTHQGIKYHLL